MWASRPFQHDNDMPIDLRKKVVLQRDQEERRESTETQTGQRWPPVAVLPVDNLHPFVSEQYKGRCSVVNPVAEGPDVKHGGRGTLETAIRKLHHKKEVKVAEPSKDERCRSTGMALENSEEDIHLDGKRSSSCPNLSVIKPKPSPIKPKSSFIQRSFESISNSTSEATNLSVRSTTNHRLDLDERSNTLPKCGAKKRKSFIPVYGDNRAPSTKGSISSEDYFSLEKRRQRPPSPEEYTLYEKRHPWSLVKNESYYSPRRPRSPFEREEFIARPRSPGDEYFHPYEKRPRSPAEDYYSRSENIRPQSPLEHEEYFSHPEVLLRRQLQQHSPSPYLVHVYDYYQQLVQRMREHSSPGIRAPPPISPPSGDEDTQMDGQRKRPCRALTGKHVRQGTGASISTLMTLRQKIQERQKAKDNEPRMGIIGNCNRNGSPKKNKVQKIKSKLPIQIQKC